MAGPIENQVCKHCGEPAVEGRVALDGSVTYLCARHIDMNGHPPQPHEADTPPEDQQPKG